MPSRLAHTPETTAQRRQFRQTGAMTLGVATIVICALILLLGLRSLHRLHLLDVLWPVAVSLFAWAVFVRPCVVLTDQAVLIRNLVRDVRIPWRAVQRTESRWNLQVITTGGAGYGSWAITRQRPKTPRVQRMGFGGLGGMSRAERRQPVDTAAYLNPPDRPESAAGVAARIEEDKAVFDRRPDAGSDGAGPRVQPAWGAIAALVGAVVLVIVGILG